MAERNLTESESLQLIASMINRAKNNWSENGFLYLLWGWVVLLCAIGQFVLVSVLGITNGYLIWMVTWLVAIYQVFYLKRNRRQDRVRTYTDELATYIWISFIVAVSVSIFISAQLHIPTMIEPVLLMLYGIPIFISGGLLKFRPLVFGGILCWLLSGLSPFVQTEYRILLIALAVAGAWIIPGYLLQQRFHKSKSSHTTGL